MYIRRKVFSILTDEMGEEKLFSVNETLLEGYEYDEVDDRYFSKKEEEDDDDKLRFGDRVELAINKHLNTKQGRKAEKAAAEGKVGKAIIEGGKIFVPVGAVAGGIGGALATKNVKGALKGAAVGAAVGGAGTAGYGVGTAGVKVLRKISPRYEELAERRLDLLKMADGEMTKKEFKKKHYKK